MESSLVISGLGLRQRFYRIGKRFYWCSTPLILAGALFPAWSTPFFGLAALALALCVISMLIGAVTGLVRLPQPTAAALDEIGLRLETPQRAIELPREALLDGMVIAPAGRFALRLHDRAGDRYELAMPDEDTAWRWLHALGLSADRRAVRVVSDRVVLQGVLGYFLSSIPAMPLMLAWMLVFAAIGGRDPGGAAMMLASIHGTMFGVWAISRLVGHVDVTVGGDGLRVGTGLRRRYIPFEALDGVARDGRGVLTLSLRSRRRPLSLRFASASDAEAVAVRIAAARAASQASMPPTGVSRLKVAPDADEAAWRAAFMEAVGDGSYRAAALTVADLEAVVTSTAVSHEQRIGAALALRELQPERGRTGVRVASELLVDDEAHEALATLARRRSG